MTGLESTLAASPERSRQAGTSELANAMLLPNALLSTPLASVVAEVLGGHALSEFGRPAAAV